MMYRYRIVCKKQVTVIDGDVGDYKKMLLRDEKVINRYLEILNEVETVDLKDLTLLTLKTKNRPTVLWGIKGEFNISHNETQECMMAALRIYKRVFSGIKDVGEKTRVVHNRRFNLTEDGVILLPLRIHLRVASGDLLSIGELLSIRLSEKYLILHYASFDEKKFERHIGIDVGKVLAIAIVNNKGNLAKTELFESTSEVFDFISQYNSKEVIIKIGLPTKSMKNIVDELYFKLLEVNFVVYVINESYTSVTCNSCHNEGSRISRIFWCDCGLKINADVNAAINIARRPRVLRRGRVYRDKTSNGVENLEEDNAEIEKLSTQEQDNSEILGVYIFMFQIIITICIERRTKL
jgi:hypothetical protein